MKKILMTQILTGKGGSRFDGLFDRNGRPAQIEIKVDDLGTVLTVSQEITEHSDLTKNGSISEEDIDRECREHMDCCDCPLYDYCNDEGDNEDE